VGESRLVRSHFEDTEWLRTSQGAATYWEASSRLSLPGLFEPLSRLFTLTESFHPLQQQQCPPESGFGDSPPEVTQSCVELLASLGQRVRVTAPRLLLLLSLVFGFAACRTEPGSETIPPRYYLVQVTDLRGHLVANWVAHGYPIRTDRGYRFEAIERFSGPPFVQQIHYPEGHRVEIGGANIVITRCGEPQWHYEMRRLGR
jgi:hypothetical protein